MKKLYIVFSIVVLFFASCDMFTVDVEEFFAPKPPQESEDITYTITFDANGGTGTMLSQVFTKGVSQNLIKNVFERVGYAFTGWTSTIDGSGTLYTDGQSYSATANTTLYAKWTPNMYTVTFDANGGTGTMQAQELAYGVAQNLTENSFTGPSGKYFAGWATTSTATNVEHSDKDSVLNLTHVDGAIITLYALWSDVPVFIVTFNSNDGTNRTTTQAFTQGVSQELDANSFIRTGYTFDGWNTDSSGNGTMYAEGETFTATENSTLYAMWSIKTYTLSFNLDGGTGNVNDITVTYNEPIGTLPTDPTKIGYRFSGWDIDGNVLSSSTLWSYDENKTATALWSANTYTVAFDANGGTGTMESQHFTYDEPQNLRAHSFTAPSDMVFAGWAMTSTATSEEYSDEESLINLTSTHGETIILYAVWETTSYTVTFNANGGANKDITQIFEHKVEQELKENTFVRAGYIFDGWNTAIDGTGTPYSDGQKYTATDDITLYAMWIDFGKLPSVYLDGTALNNGDGTKDTPYNTFESAKTHLLGTGGTILILGTVTVAESQTWSSELNTPIIVKRESTFTDEIIDVTGETFIIQNITLDGQGGIQVDTDGDGTNDFIGEGSVVARNSLVKVTNASFILKNGAVLQNSNYPAVTVNAGGFFNMETGRITNNVTSSGAGGVYVANGGNFDMAGGIISNNTTTTTSSSGGVYVANGGNFDMAGGIIAENTTTTHSSSGGVYVANGGNFEMTGGSIAENTTTSYSSGGGVYVASGGNFDMAGGSITENLGVGVYVYAGTFTMNDGSITDNETSSNGGGVHVANGGIFDMVGGSITGNKTTGSSSYGGGVYMYSGAFTMTGGDITGNKTTGSSSYGGGVYMYSGAFTMTGGDITDNIGYFGGGVHIKDGTFTFAGGSIENNTATYEGGGVHVLGGTFIMNDGNITENKTTASSSSSTGGGGVHVDNSGTFTMNAGNIANNSSNDEGGGVFVNGDFSMKAGSIKDNETSTRGGGVYVEGGTFTMEGGSITDNEVLNSSNYYSGGGVYVGSTSGGIMGTFKLKGTPIITGNYKKDSITNNIDYTYTETESPIKITGPLTTGANIGLSPSYPYLGILVQNEATHDFEENYFSMDDGVSSFIKEDNHLKLVFPKVSNVYLSSGGNDRRSGADTNNTVKTFDVALSRLEEGGSIWVTSSATVDSDQTWSTPSTWSSSLTIKRYDANENSGMSTYSNKGNVINVTGGILTLENIIIDGMGGITADFNADGVDETGLGSVDASSSLIQVKSGGTLVLENGVFLQNNKINSSASGGGVLVSGGTLTMNGGSIAGNQASAASYYSSSGGGVSISSGTFTMNGGSITGNEASSSGGGVYISGGTFTMNAGSITNNEASRSGGGVYVSSGTFTMKNGSITGNITTTPNSSSIAYGGGGVYVSSGNFVMENGTITGNQVSSSGGGVYVAGDATFTIESGSIIGNMTTDSSSYSKGGGVYIGTSSGNTGTVKLKGSPTITGNLKNGITNNISYAYGNTESPIKFTGPLTVGAQIGLTPDTTIYEGILVQNEATHDFDERSFTIDNGGSSFIKEDNHLKLVFPKVSNVYLSSYGDDRRSGADTNNSVRTFDGALSRLLEGGNIWIMNSITVDSDQTWSTPSTWVNNVTVKRYDASENSGMLSNDFRGILINVTGGTLTLESITIDGMGGIIADFNADGTDDTGLGNNTASDSLVQVLSGATLILNNDAILQNNKVSNYSSFYGGGVYVAGGTLSMNGGRIIGNEMSSSSSYVSSYGGGGVYVGDGGTFTLETGIIADNKSSASSGSSSAFGGGGGVHIADGATFTMAGGSINDNEDNPSFYSYSSSYGGGGVYVAGGATFTMEGGSITENKALGGSVGGGVYVNTASSWNMGVFRLLGTPIIVGNFNKDGTENNVKYTYTDTESPIKIAGPLTSGAQIGLSPDTTYLGVLVQNEATHYFEESSFIMDDGVNGRVKEDNHLKLVFPKIDNVYMRSYGDDRRSGADTNNTIKTFEVALSRLNDGGTIWITNSINITSDQTWSTPTTWLNDLTMKRYDASENPGMSSSDFKETLIIVTGGTFTLENITIDGMGGIEADFNADGTVEKGFGNVVATGALIGVSSSGALTLENGTVLQNNHNVTSSFSQSSYIGGGVSIEGGVLVMNGGTIIGNYCYAGHASTGQGGGVFMEGGTFTMKGGTITANRTSSVGYAGSGVHLGDVYDYDSNTYVNGATFYMEGGSITGNNANGGGGAVYITPTASLNLKGNPIISDNVIGGSITSSGYTGGTKNNVSFMGSRTNARIYITEQLDTTARIGLSPEENYTSDILVQSTNASWFTVDNFPMDDDSTATHVDASGNLVEGVAP